MFKPDPNFFSSPITTILLAIGRGGPLNSCTVYKIFHMALRLNDFDAGKSIMRAIGRAGP
jgi:hypothetical protein